MYVKWEERLERRGSTAVLVEAIRVDGKPRQRHIAYLSTYPGPLSLFWEDEDNVRQRAWFWHRVRQRLDNLDLTAEQRKHIETLMAKRLPEPTPAEITAYDQVRRPWLGNWPPGTLGVTAP
jgi:hypothetical protein